MCVCMHAWVPSHLQQVLRLTLEAVGVLLALWQPVPLLLHRLRALQLVPRARQRADQLGAGALQEAVRRAAAQRRAVDVLAEDLALEVILADRLEGEAAVHHRALVVLAVREAAVDAAAANAALEILALLCAAPTAAPTAASGQLVVGAVREAAAPATGAHATGEIVAQLLSAATTTTTTAAAAAAAAAAATATVHDLVIPRLGGLAHVAFPFRGEDVGVATRADPVAWPRVHAVVVGGVRRKRVD